MSRYNAQVMGNEIKKVRKARKLSQDNLARYAGIDRSYMGRIERGQVNVTVKLAYQIAEVLGCPVNKILP